jgi:hypothetical protein
MERGISVEEHTRAFLAKGGWSLQAGNPRLVTDLEKGLEETVQALSLPA